MNRLQVAVVGAGALGRHHARILSTLPGVELVAVAELNETAGRAVATACQTRWVPDYREVVDGLDAVVLATPTSLHHRIARDLLLSGIDLFVEKPLTASVSEARELVELARRDELVLQVGHVERFNPGYVAARPAIRDPKYIRTER
ncbi:MAG: Gfo/Idh/MocA family protein, partial [Planctomycetaceae bacterium]